MNIEIANRLVNLRKANNLSQEALAEKLGISRQAVSKWERAEASPDTDNLIMLARLYGVSLDELLKTDEDIPRREADDSRAAEETVEAEEASPDENGDKGKRRSEYVNISPKGVHVIDKDGSEVRVGWTGIHVDDRKSDTNVNIDKEGVFINGVEYDDYDFKYNWHCLKGHQSAKFPLTVIVTVTYICLGLFMNLWHPAWLLFLLIPIWSSLVEAIYKKNAHIFAYPLACILAYLSLGIFCGLWHPGWAIFLTIPVYYSLVAYVRSLKRAKRARREEGDVIDV